MKLPPLSFAVLDTETTGFVPRVHHVIEYAAVRVEKGTVTDTYEQLFAVDGEIPPHVQVLTRIKPEALAGMPTFEEKRSEIESKLAGLDILVGQNLSFDIGMIRGEGIDLSEHPWVDTSMLASLVFPEFRSFSLPYMSAQLHLTHEPEHRALGDVHATLELFMQIWERLLLLPPDKLAEAKEVIGRSTEGYRRLFAALPESTSKSAEWITPKIRTEVSPSDGKALLTPPAIGTVELHEEGLHCDCLQHILNASANDAKTTQWIAVKNLESALKRIRVPEGITVVHPPQLLLNPDASKMLEKQESLSPEEALITLKIRWFQPRTRNDIAIHGGEKDLWNGRLACATTSSAYTEQFTQKPRAFLLDHRQLLSFLADPEHPSTSSGQVLHAAYNALTPDAHIIVDDASMLEDTATKAYGHYIGLDDLRAASTNDKDLTRFTDLFALFCEVIRQQNDQYFLTPADLRRSEPASLRDQLTSLLTRTDLPEKTLEQLRAARALLEENLPEQQLIWIERRQDGSITLQSAPKHVDTLLEKYLYSKYATTLLVPKGSHGVLPEIVPAQANVTMDDGNGFAPCPLTVNFPVEQTLATFLKNPPPGKTIALVGSKRLIDQAFIQHTEELEAQGVTLICQGYSGGQGRMESDFLAAESPAILLTTPFMYEGLDFPLGSVDRLVLEAVPFDHPNNPVMSRRKERYKNSFTEYAMPRVEYRLFRLMRTFCRHRKENAEMLVFDRRLVEKDYGSRLQRYMAQFATSHGPIIEAPAPSVSGKSKKPAKTKKAAPVKKKKETGQMQLPI